MCRAGLWADTPGRLILGGGLFRRPCVCVCVCVCVCIWCFRALQLHWLFAPMSLKYFSPDYIKKKHPGYARGITSQRRGKEKQINRQPIRIIRKILGPRVK